MDKTPAELAAEWQQRAINWKAIAKEGADSWIVERSLARSSAWKQAADELAEALGLQPEPCIHPGVFARTSRPSEHCYTCNRDVPIQEL